VDPPINITGKIAYGIALGDIPGYMRYTQQQGAIGLLLFDPLGRTSTSISKLEIDAPSLLTKVEL
jgi:hypothetical protein